MKTGDGGIQKTTSTTEALIVADVHTRNYEQATADTKPGDVTPCQQCGELYVVKREKQRFCKPLCRVKHWNRSHPRIDLGEFKLQKGDRKPTAQELEAAGYTLPKRRRA